jgi:preprotein translocase subunit SecF
MRPLFVFLKKPPKVPFVSLRRIGFAVSIVLTLASVVLVATRGLNFGIDFRGGIVMEVQNPKGPANLEGMRAVLNGLGLGDVALQTFGTPNDVLIRLPRQPGGDAEQGRAVEKARAALGTGYDYRRTEVVGPKVGNELIRAGQIAALSAILAIAAYIWFRFEWQFGIGAMISIVHDVVSTLGLFAALQMEFNLATLAAILTIAGYSINDKVVVYDRVRENMRKYKTMAFSDLLDLSLNETLSRTIMTSSATALAVLALLLFGGEVIRGFSAAMLWGIVIGTYSSLFVATPLLLYIQPRRNNKRDAAPAPGGKGKPA